MSTPSPGPISSTTSSASSSASRPITPRMFSSARKCWPSCFFGTTVTEREGARRVRVDLRRELVRVLAAGGRERRERVDDVRGLVRPAAQRLRREVRAVGLGEDPVGGDRAALAQLGGLRVSDVAGERDVVAALERGREQHRRREAMQDDGAAACRASARGRVLVGRAGVDDDRLARARSPARAAPRRGGVAVVRRVVAVVVEPGLARPRPPSVREQLAELVERVRLSGRPPGEGGCRARRRRRPPLGDRERRAARLDPGPDRDITRSPRPARARSRSPRPDRRSASRCACVSITPRRRVPSARARPRRPCSGSSLLKSGFGSRSACPAGSSLGPQCPTHARSRP